MATFAQFDLAPGGVVAWVVVGLMAGFLAGRLMRGGKHGLVGDLVVGVVGAVIGGFLVGVVVTGDYRIVGSTMVAFLAACLLVWMAQQIAPGPPLRITQDPTSRHHGPDVRP